MLKQILDKIVSFILTSIGLLVIALFCCLYFYPTYKRLSFMHNCTQKHSEQWCQEAFISLDRLD